MTIDLTAEQAASVNALARQSGKSVPDAITETVEWLLQMDAFHEAVLTHSIAQADCGDFIEEEEMDARFAQMLSTP